MDELPRDFVSRMTDLHGPSAWEWLHGLPSRIQSLQERWQIQVLEPFQPLAYNYVAPALRSDGTEAILKLGVPGTAIDQEAECLQVFGGDGAPYLLEHDSKLGAILLERIRPGSDIKGLDEEQGVMAVADVMRKLHRPPETTFPFPTVEEWGQGFQRLRDRFSGDSGPFPSGLVDEGEELFTSLASSMGSRVLLHGDLHHRNVLAGDRQPWLGIDPQGVIGEPAYEIGAFLRNPMPDFLDWADLEAVTARRINLFSDILGLDKSRIAGWGFAQAILSAIWSLEDHGSGWDSALIIAEVLREFCSA